MTEPQIVSCPGCGKRYSVPPGAAPGQFQCQDCSSVVVYGQRAGAAPAGRPHGKSARSHAKAEAAKRRMARDRERDDDDDEGDRRGSRGGHGGKDQKSPMPYLLAFVGLGIVGAGIAFAVNSSDPTPPAKGTGPPAKAGAPSAPAEEVALGKPSEAPRQEPMRETPREPPPPPPGATAPPEAPKPASGGIKTALRGGITDKKDDFKPAANPPSGGNYGKAQAALLTMLKENRFSVVTDLGHLPDTPGEVAQKIDEEIPKFSDPNAGSAFFRSRERLLKLGRPAIPRVLGVAAKLDFSKYSKITDAAEICQVADAIDEVMRGITGYDKFTMLQYNPNSKLEDYPRVIDEWFLWWYTIGYRRETFYKPEGADAEEKL
jgi:hypothetical protein